MSQSQQTKLQHKLNTHKSNDSDEMVPTCHKDEMVVEQTPDGEWTLLNMNLVTVTAKNCKHNMMTCHNSEVNKMSEHGEMKNCRHNFSTVQFYKVYLSK